MPDDLSDLLGSVERMLWLQSLPKKLQEQVEEGWYLIEHNVPVCQSCFKRKKGCATHVPSFSDGYCICLKFRPLEIPRAIVVQRKTKK